MKKECVAMLLAGGQGSRLYVLTGEMAKPAVPFGGKYRIIDFPLSNCSNSGIDTVGVLTQYRPLELNSYIGSGQPWDLDGSTGGVHILPPYMDSKGGTWYKGTANAIYQNIGFVDYYEPDYVVILSGDHIYKMDYSKMVARHKESGAACTISVMEVPWEEAPRFGIMSVNEDDMITEFAEKPKAPKSNLASMGIYVFSWKTLRQYLTEDEADPTSENDFGKNVIPAMLENGEKMAAYRFAGYWKDVGTLESLWDANMDMLSPESGLDLHDESWPVYARSVNAPPTFLGTGSRVAHSAFNRGSILDGDVQNSVLASNVRVGKGARISYSVLLPGTVVEENAVVEYAILGEDCRIGVGCRVGGAPEDTAPSPWGLTVLAPHCRLPDGKQVRPGIMLDRNGEEVSK
ncbi:glucose-1-phosphate adenylyltransferase [Oscillibacter sp.]|uniref:glucose-1-phosphate adenylyltransferase n=1 Tax=Oscillibacter sp. TaxID=1945593 RepID=UPI0026191C0B|nr:glucose-1-phosphate adenylyltransferase [Oscillibacter sp.]MDD3347708.1 glucose-1-phosphate adenylyltransferase [Oscillibacter sp.]